VSNECFLKEKFIGLVVGSNFLDCWFSRLMVLSFMRRIGFGLKARLGLGFSSFRLQYMQGSFLKVWIRFKRTYLCDLIRLQVIKTRNEFIFHFHYEILNEWEGRKET
jgi:hypothetical protein